MANAFQCFEEEACNISWSKTKVQVIRTGPSPVVVVFAGQMVEMAIGKYTFLDSDVDSWLLLSGHPPSNWTCILDYRSARSHLAN